MRFKVAEPNNPSKDRGNGLTPVSRFRASHLGFCNQITLNFHRREWQFRLPYPNRVALT